jgi:hypothetical protein
MATPRVRNLVCVACSLASILALAACKSKSAGAREVFGSKYSCPDDRITLKPRPDINPGEALTPAGWLKPKTPPAEVKSDPGRLAKWKADEDERIERLRGGYSDYEMFEVSGCDHTSVLGCHQREPEPRRQGGDGVLRGDPAEVGGDARRVSTPFRGTRASPCTAS